MDPKSLTDEIIDTLLSCPKQIKNKRAKETEKAKHKERNYEVVSADGDHTFTLFIRQSALIPDSFSCGLVWHAAPSQKVILARYNGSDHYHGNPIEGDEFAFACHIHRATERYIQAGRKSEHYATETNRYHNVDSALKCLVEDFNISGLPPSEQSPDFEPQSDLFK